MKNKLMTAAVVLLLVSSLIIGIVNFVGTAQPVQASITGAEPTKKTISTNGTYSVKVAPDIAYISIGVNTFAKDPKEAQKENKQKMDGVFKKIKSLGIADKDIKTTNYSIYPRYEWNNIESKGEKGYIERKSEQILVGYEVNNMIQVTIRNLNIVGSVIDVTVEEGINQANSISFGLSDEKREEVYLEALKRAVENAKAKAETMASVYGIQLGKPSNIIENGSYVPQPIMYRGYADAKVAAEESASTPISAGELKIRANVNVVYEY